MPKVLSHLKKDKRGPPHITEPLTFHAMGAGYNGFTSPSTGSVQVPVSCKPIISPSGSKLCLSPKSRDSRWSNSCGRTSYVALASRTPSYQTTERTSPAERWLLSTPSTRSHIGSLRCTIHKAMAKLRSAIAQFSTASARASERQKANGSRSFLEYAGHTG